MVLLICQNFQPSTVQRTLSNRGLTFTPTKGYYKNFLLKCKYDIQQYHRRVKLAIHYGDKSDTEPQPFTPKSDGSPPMGQLPPEVSTLVKADYEYFQDHFHIDRIKPNLTGEETKALKELRENKQIIIKPADKGSAVVILDRDQYLQEGYRQLNDTTYYSKLKKPIYLETLPIVEKIINNLYQKKFINMKQKNYLLGSPEPRGRLFYER